MTKLYAKKSQFFSPFFFLSFFFREEGKKNGEIVLKKRLCERGVTYIFFTQRWKRRHRKPGRPSSRANTRTASSSVRTRECPRVRFVVVVVVSRGIFVVVAHHFILRFSFVQVRLLFCRDLIIIIIGLFTLSRNNNNNNNRDVHFQPRVG